MEYKIQYNSKEDREKILSENPTKILVEEQNLFTGNFLVLADEPRKYVTVKNYPTEEIEQIKQDNLILMDALATIYEAIALGGAV